MEIERHILEKIAGLGPQAHADDVLVSLFILSKKDNYLRLKVLDLTKIDLVKLRRLIEEERFVPVVETAEEISAYMTPKIASRIAEGEQNLRIEGKEGKKTTVKTVTEEISKQISVIAELFEDYLQANKEEKEETKVSHSSDGTVTQALAITQYLSNHILLSDQTKMAYVLARLENVPGQIILDCLKKFNEEQRIEEKRREEKAKLDDIKQTEINKGIERQTIAKEQAFSQNMKKAIISRETMLGS